MRAAIQNALQAGPYSHFGHAYDLLAPPPGPDGKVDPQRRNEWLRQCGQVAVADDYVRFYERWRHSFSTTECTIREVEATSRVLLGHGNPSGSDVGLTVHRTWGVPILPGSAQKGLVSHYVDAVYGADDPVELERRAWRGPTWTGRSINPGDGAGEVFGHLFGAPAVEGEEGSARRGFVEFQDAVYVPKSAGGRPFARDVLTVHHKSYYDAAGASWPNDWDSPNPVGFITVKPGTRFMLVLTGPVDWRDRALTLLLAALAEWGIGGKTSAGYGRLTARPSTR